MGIRRTPSGPLLTVAQIKALPVQAKVYWEYTCTNGQPVMGSLHVIANLDHLSALAVIKFGTRVQVIQPPFNTGVPQSEGTHDFDYAMDWYIPGVDGRIAQTLARANGWADWFRVPWQGFTYHNHGFPLPPNGKVFPTRVGIYLPGQLDDYWRRAYGLKGMHNSGADPSWFPTDIMATRYGVAQYIRDMERDTMEYKDWSDASKKEFLDDIAARLLDAESVQVVQASGKVKKVRIRAALARSASTAGVVRNEADKLGDKIDEAQS